MNSANLQLEGLYIAFASVLNTMVAKGVLSRDDIDLAMSKAETIVSPTTSARRVETRLRLRRRGGKRCLSGMSRSNWQRWQDHTE